jgi:hypothetical protein
MMSAERATVCTGGMRGWQITMIAIVVALITATVAVQLDRAWASRWHARRHGQFGFHLGTDVSPSAVPAVPHPVVPSAPTRRLLAGRRPNPCSRSWCGLARRSPLTCGHIFAY